MAGSSAAAAAQRLLDGGPLAVGGADVVNIADLLKAEAERQLNVDAHRSLEIANLICHLQSEGSVHALGLMARADALRVLGRFAEAMQAYQDSADLYRRGGDEVGWARTHIGAMLAARSVGMPGRLLAELDEARRILTTHGLWLRLARLENHSGALLSAVGQNREALEAHERALAAATRLEPRNDLLEAEILGNLSLAHYQFDDFEPAEAYHERAVSIFEREGQHEDVRRANRNYARYAVARGHLSKALAAVLRGRRSLQTMGRTQAAAHLGQVGVDCLIRLNRTAEAADLAIQVADEFESSGARVEAAATLGLRSLALARLGHSEAALSDLERCEALFGSAEWEAGQATVRLGRAVVLGETGQWAQALDEAVAARDELWRRGLVARTVEADLIRARALRAVEQHAQAMQVAYSTLDLLRGRGLPWLGYHLWRLIGELARDEGKTDEALTAFLEAIANLEHVQGRILTEYRTSFLADKADTYEAAVSLSLDRGDTHGAFELVERAKSRALVDAIAGGLDIRVRARNPEQAALVDELTELRRQHDVLVSEGSASTQLPGLEGRIGALLEELRLTGVDDLERLSLLEARVYSPRDELDSATAIVEYYFVGEDLVAFVMDRQQLRVGRIWGALPRLVRLQRSLRINIEAAASAPEHRAGLAPNARALLHRMHTVLLAPLAKWLAAYTRLIFVAHGVLHQVPFAALYDGHQHLIERFEVSNAPSASSLAFCLRPRVRTGIQALVVADSADGALPGVIAEAKSVAALFDGECLLDQAVTRPAFRQHAREADLIHVAAHGMSRPDMPLFSHLRLADGQLTALDCFDLELDCALVTLSACESGHGLVDAGDEQIGLPRAFLYAGARAVLYSLWRIDDEATRSLIEQFYRDLRVGHGRGAALRAAQLASLRSPAAHPFLWAAMVLTGDWR